MHVYTYKIQTFKYTCVHWHFVGQPVAVADARPVAAVAAAATAEGLAATTVETPLKYARP